MNAEHYSVLRPDERNISIPLITPILDVNGLNPCLQILATLQIVRKQEKIINVSSTTRIISE
jgi:hypothetical protein